MTKKILMCPPDYFGIEYEINPWMNVRVGSDTERSRLQWDDLVETLRELAVEIELMAPVAGLPDLVFTANAGLVYRNQFICSRFRFPVRQGESAHFAARAAELGFEVVHLPAGYHFEGAGDALFCGETLFAGYRFRSDVRSHQWVGERLGVEVLPMELVNPRFYHLDTCFCPIAPGWAIYYPAQFDEYGRSVLRDRDPQPDRGGRRGGGILQLQRGGGRPHGGAQPGRLEAGRHAPRRGVHDAAAGVLRVHQVGGQRKCLTLRLDGEEAAAWKTVGRVNGSGRRPPLTSDT